MSEICKAHFRLTRAELVAALRHHQRLIIRRGVLMLMKGFSILLLTFMSITLVAWFLFPSTSAPPFGAVIALTVFSLYWLVFDRLNVWYSARGFNKRPDANSQVEWQFSNEQIYVQTDLAKVTMLWKSFVKIVVTSDRFLFYPLRNIFYWVPFSAFESPDCVDKVREFIRQNDIPIVERPKT